jgi:hypothetical protein
MNLGGKLARPSKRHAGLRQPRLRVRCAIGANVLFAADRGRWTGGLTVVC